MGGGTCRAAGAKCTSSGGESRGEGQEEVGVGDGGYVACRGCVAHSWRGGDLEGDEGAFRGWWMRK